MAARRKSQPVVTLFAFQDVIMSVSGIIIVVVLLLTLELIQKPENASAAASADVSDRLRAEIERADAAMGELEARLQSNDERIQNSAALSPADLRRQTELSEAESALLAAEIARLQSQVDELKPREQAVRIEAVERGDVRDRADAARRTAEALEEQLETERTENRPVFQLPRGFNKEGWIAVVSSADVTVAPIGRAGRPRVFAAEGGFLGQSAAAVFVEWAASAPESRNYVLLLIRPDGTNAYDRIAAGLDARRIPYGFDLVPAGQTVLHPERGAYE